MNDEAALAQFEAMDLGMEPVNGIVQPPVIPPEGKRHRNTDALQYVLKTVVKAVSKHNFAWPFMTPVNAVKLELPVSFQILCTFKKYIFFLEYQILSKFYFPF